jgi:hypothetical protein
MSKRILFVTALVVIVATLGPSLLSQSKSNQVETNQTLSANQPGSAPVAEVRRVSGHPQVTTGATIYPEHESGRVYDKAPLVSKGELKEMRESTEEVDLHPEIPQGEIWETIPAPNSPPTTPVTSMAQEWNPSRESAAQPEALGPNDFRYQAVHDISEVGSTSTVDEPSVGNMGNTILFTGNWYAAVSTDAGKTFRYISPRDTFREVNGGFCCDQVVNYAPVQDMMLWALQYVKDSDTNTLKIARAVGSSQVSQNSWVSYSFTPQDFGYPSGYWFDFPNLTVGSTYLYATSNVFSTKDNSPNGGVLWRVSLADLATGVPLKPEYFAPTHSKDDVSSLRCTEGAGLNMFCAGFKDTSTIRIVRWDDSGTPAFDDIKLEPFTPIGYDQNKKPDAVAIGPDGSNWAGRVDGRIQAAWASKGILGFMWAARQDATFPYPYTIVAQFDQATRAKISQTPIWATDTAFLYPSVAVNSSRNLAGLISYGGGLFTPGSNIWISDDVQSGFSPLNVYGAAPGSTDGPNGDEWGDYQTVRRHKDSTNTWVAATFRLTGGGDDGDVLPRYLWFGRVRDLPVLPSGNANLTPFKPFFWSDKIVVSRFPNKSTDDSLLSNADTLYADWAVINNGNLWTETKFFLTFYLDGVARGSWYSAPVMPNDYVYLQDVRIGPLSAGTHTLKIVADSEGGITESSETDNEYTKTITVQDIKSNLTPFKPSGWADKIVVSNRSGTNLDNTGLTSNDSLFIDWAVLNSGGISTQSKFYSRLYVDNVERNFWYTDAPLNANTYAYVEDFGIGKLSVGTHTIKLVTDADSSIIESSESDNEFTKQIAIAPPPAVLELSSSLYTTAESSGFTNINVLRSGDTSGAVNVAFATSNGTAKEGKDYVATQGVLRFAAGETSKSVPVLIIDNAFVDLARTVNITLANPSGASLGTSKTAVLTIIDNDIVLGPNPITQPRPFVQYHYYDFLGRYPDAGGWDFWTNNITGCSPQPSCIEAQRVNTSAAYFLSIEFQGTGYLVYRIYKASFGNLTDIPNAPVPIKRAEFVPDTQEIGNGVIVNFGNWQQLLETNKQAFTLGFVQRSRFVAAFPTTMTPAQFVDKLFANAGVTPSTIERNTAINEFGGASNTSDVAARSRALRDVAENPTLTTREFNKAFVLMQYFGYLRRNPYDPPEASLDYSGFNFWLGKMNFYGNYNDAEMVKAFISSSEYRQRFGP